ncbi:MAG TPA: Rpn family recombination-promoting nuclease/putative transposase [Myxococcales bacterium]|jgi:predicted transposase/invertase (TIGR01784 family)
MGEITKPHDHFFKALLDDPESAGALLRERLPPEVAELLADEPPEPVEGTLVDPALEESESDRIFRAKLRGGAELFVYCLIEHQSTADPRMPLRLLGYVSRLYERLAADQATARLPAILPMVVYQGEAAWTAPVNFTGMLNAPEAVLRHCLDFRYTLLDLGKVGDEELSRQRKLHMGLLALKYALRVREQLSILDDLAALVARLPEMQEPLKTYILCAYGAVEETVFDAVWSKHMSKPDLGIASPIAKEWYAEGKAEGEAKGKAEGKAEALLRMLAKRFGEVPARYNQLITAAVIEDLDTWLDRAIDAPSLDAVFAPTAH